jgi:hypothetical protein
MRAPEDDTTDWADGMSWVHEMLGIELPQILR